LSGFSLSTTYRFAANLVPAGERMMARPEYSIFMAVVDRAGVDARGNLLFQRAPDGEILVFDEEVIERVREGGEVEMRRTTRRNRRIHAELPLVAEKYKQFRATGEVTL